MKGWSRSTPAVRDCRLIAFLDLINHGFVHTARRRAAPQSPAHIYCDVYLDVTQSFYNTWGEGLTVVWFAASFCVRLRHSRTTTFTLPECWSHLPSLTQAERVTSAVSKVLTVFALTVAIYDNNFNKTTIGLVAAGLTVCLPRSTAAFDRESWLIYVCSAGVH